MLGKLAAILLGRENAMKAPISHGATGIAQVGHREYVGGKWEEIGTLQFDFMLQRGLEPHHIFLDLGCGSLRGGVHFIRYLNRGNYLGIDKESILIHAGIEKELGQRMYEEKVPEFVISDTFEFDRFSRVPCFVLTQSVFTHLTANDIDLSVYRLRQFVSKGCRFYATFFESDSPVKNPSRSHDHQGFRYSRHEMAALGEKHEWEPCYIGNWNHPRGQMMMEYVAR